ncbi:hypothetical protein [Candidatus Nitrosotalea okcheonensis]|uniref:Uncharacterized protein n=1 Tax=Candidatus Nitrosotalea okcheonensis TaxID=1903276 RepID=A0A2H1FCN8_9ARCH|nr:hypothetical protein [Candidatus Nitrosotalea okcheonensis]MDE1831088.1 hypothetical protein [Nitrososphaerota archaeon]MDE1840574.1 hypothetical protein [Nitrososphaerota archaeon]SMH70528.1 protein of unknown function [Candidatus Nitrosotalea okcheonensis]
MHHSNSHERSRDAETRNSDVSKIKNEMETADKIFYKELSSKYFLLDKFGIGQLKDMCNNLLGKGPDVEYYEDQITKKKTELPQYKEDFIHFIIDEFRFAEIKEYALKKGIVTKHFFEK